MIDIYLGIALVLGLAVLVGWATLRVAPRLTTLSVALLGSAAAAGTWAWVAWRDDPAITRFLPFSNAIVLSNWAPICLAVLVGLAMGVVAWTAG